MEVVKSLLRLLDEMYISKDNLKDMLAVLNIHGAVRDSGGYIGFDYDTQEWIDIS